MSLNLAKAGTQVGQGKIISLEFTIPLYKDGPLFQDIFVTPCSRCGKLKRISVRLLSSVGAKSQ